MNGRPSLPAPGAWPASVLAIAGLALACTALTARGAFEILPLDDAPGPLLPLHLLAPFGAVGMHGPPGLSAGFLYLRPYGMDELRFDAAGLGWETRSYGSGVYAARLGAGGYDEWECGVRVHRRRGPGMLVRAVGTFPDHTMSSEYGIAPLRAVTVTPTLSGSAGSRLVWSLSWRDAFSAGDAASLGLQPSAALRADLDLGQGWGLVWACGWSATDPGRDRSRIAITWTGGSSLRIGQDWSGGLNASWAQARAGGVQGQAWVSQVPGGPSATTGLCVSVARRPDPGRPSQPTAGTRGSESLRHAPGRSLMGEVPEWMEDGVLLDGVPLLITDEADSLGAWTDSLMASLSQVEEAAWQESTIRESGRDPADVSPGRARSAAGPEVATSRRSPRLAWQDTRRRSSTRRWSEVQRMDGSLAAGSADVRFAIRRYQGVASLQESGWASVSSGNWRVATGVGGHPMRWGMGLLARSRVVSLRRGAAAGVGHPESATLASVSRPTGILAPLAVGSRRHVAASFRAGAKTDVACAVSDGLVQAALEASGVRHSFGILGESRDGVTAAGVHLARAHGTGLIQSELAVRESEGIMSALRWSAVADCGAGSRIWWDIAAKQPLLVPSAGEGVARLRERSIRPVLSVRVGGSTRECGGTFAWTSTEPPSAAAGSRSASRSWTASLSARPGGMGSWSTRLYGATRAYTCPGAVDDPLAPVPCRRRRQFRSQTTVETDPHWERRASGSWGLEIGTDLESRSTCGGLLKYETRWWTGVFRRHAVRGPGSMRVAGSAGLLHADSGPATSVQVSPVWVAGPRRTLRGEGLWLGADLRLRSRRFTWLVAGVLPAAVGGVAKGREGGGLETRLEMRTW